MKRVHQLVTVIGLSLVSILLSSPAPAQCGGVAKHISYRSQAGPGGGRFQLAAATQAPDAFGDNARGEYGLEPVVGLWKLDFEDPAANYSDKGYAVWHSDHTELMNSTRPPSVGAICQGVWEKVGHLTYRLNHFALAYADGVNLTTVYQFKELITVDRSGNSFSGTFSIEAFDPKTHAPGPTLKGTLTGERVRIDTTIDSQNF